uniref:Uncharacterized protein n=2 Tax=Glycine max TaxID=3847 RepID=K7KTQ2_SOYBN
MDFSSFDDDQGMEMDDDMEVEDGEADEVQSEFKDKILGVLKEGDFAEKRSSKLTLQEFLYCLTKLAYTSPYFRWSIFLIVYSLFKSTPFFQIRLSLFGSFLREWDQINC